MDFVSIQKTLYSCAKGDCLACPMGNNKDKDACDTFLMDVALLLQRQNAEIQKLKPLARKRMVPVEDLEIAKQIINEKNKTIKRLQDRIRQLSVNVPK